VKIVNILSEHEVFYNSSVHAQHPVWIQVMLTFERLGCDGNGASVGHFARLTGISAGSVVKFTERVFTAMLSLKKQIIKWPDANERNAISNRFEADYGLLGAVGVEQNERRDAVLNEANQSESLRTRVQQHLLDYFYSKQT
jgi:hypothetical protein